MKRNGNGERRRHANRGAEGAEGGGSGEGVSPSPVGEGLGRGLCPLPRNFFDFFLSGNGAFNFISLKLLSADGIFIFMNTRVAYGP